MTKKGKQDGSKKKGSAVQHNGQQRGVGGQKKTKSGNFERQQRKTS